MASPHGCPSTSIRSHEGGRYAEVEQAFDAWAQLGFRNAMERYMYAMGTRQRLELAGRDREALAILEDALSHEDDGYLNERRLIYWPRLRAFRRSSGSLSIPNGGPRQSGGGRNMRRHAGK